MSHTGILVIVILYLLFLLVVGFWYSKASSTGSSEYFLGGRKMGPWVLSMSEKASESSGFMTVGLPSDVASVKALKKSDVSTKTEKEIVTQLLNSKIRTASPYVGK